MKPKDYHLLPFGRPLVPGAYDTEVHCEHCANKDKSKWLSHCLYKGSYASHRAFVLSTFDPPCAADAYDETRRESSKRRRQQFVRIAIVQAVIVSGLVWWLWW